MSVWGNKTSMSPCYLDNLYSINLHSHNLDSFDQPNKSKLTIKPYDDEVIEDGVKELTERITQTNIIIFDQPSFKNQIGFFDTLKKNK